jgi:hypothetical protein
MSGRALTSGLGIIVAAIFLVVMLRIDDNAAQRVGHRRVMPRGALDPRTPAGSVSLVMALIGGCTMAAVYVPYVVIDVGKHAPITGGCLSAVIPVSWTAAAVATASVRSARGHRFILSGPMLVTLGLILTGWALTTGSLALIALALAPVGAGIGAAWPYLGALLVEFAEARERDIAAAFISTNNLLSQAFGAAFAGMIANVAGFGDPALGSDGVLRAVLWLFAAISLFPAAALPLAVRVVRLSTRILDARSFVDRRPDYGEIEPVDGADIVRAPRRDGVPSRRQQPVCRPHAARRSAGRRHSSPLPRRRGRGDRSHRALHPRRERSRACHRRGI